MVTASVDGVPVPVPVALKVTVPTPETTAFRVLLPGVGTQRPGRAGLTIGSGVAGRRVGAPTARPNHPADRPVDESGCRLIQNSNHQRLRQRRAGRRFLTVSRDDGDRAGVARGGVVGEGHRRDPHGGGHGLLTPAVGPRVRVTDVWPSVSRDGGFLTHRPATLRRPGHGDAGDRIAETIGHRHHERLRQVRFRPGRIDCPRTPW